MRQILKFLITSLSVILRDLYYERKANMLLEVKIRVASLTLFIKANINFIRVVTYAYNKKYKRRRRLF